MTTLVSASLSPEYFLVLIVHLDMVLENVTELLVYLCNIFYDAGTYSLLAQ